MILEGVKKGVFMRGKHRGSPHPSAVALEAKILAEHLAMSPADREARYLRIVARAERRDDDALDSPFTLPGTPQSPRLAALYARQHLTLNEAKFFTESHTRWPGVRFRRYAPVSITCGVGERPSVWYAPFLCRPAKLIVILDHRDDMPYRVYSENRALYAQHGYTILDFSEDLSTPVDESVWHELYATIEPHLLHRPARAA